MRIDKLFEQLESRILLDATPDVQLNVPEKDMINEEFTFTATFDNTANPSDANPTGNAPYVNLVLPKGIDLSNIKYNGQAVSVQTLGYWDADDASGARWEKDQASTVDDTGTQIDHPFETSGLVYSDLPSGTSDGDALYMIQLPFGSFSADQPTVQLDVAATPNKANGALVNTPMIIKANSFFRYGTDAQDNPTADPPLVSSTVTGTFTPTVITLDKDVSVPENETVTGINFKRDFTLTVDIADAETISTLNVTDYLPDTLKYIPGSLTVTGGGTYTLNSTHTFTDVDDDGWNDSALDINFDNPVIGTAADNDIVITYEAYVPDQDANGVDILSHITGNDRAISIEKNVDGGDGVYTRASGSYAATNVSAVDSDVEVLTAKSIAIQKTVTNTSGSSYNTGDIVKYTLEFQISDYFSFNNVNLTDYIADGLQLDLSIQNPQMTLYQESEGGAGNLEVLAAPEDILYTQTYYPVTEANEGLRGRTKMDFDISAIVNNLTGFDNNLVGDLAYGGQTDANPDGGTMGTIVYYAKIQEEFVWEHNRGGNSAEKYIGQNDILTNNGTPYTPVISGNILTNNGLTDTGESEGDGSSTSFSIDKSHLTKSIYAINGATDWSTTHNYLSPGDTVTYRLHLNMPSMDFEDLEIKDYLPMPVYDVNDWDADGVGGDSWNVTYGATPSTTAGEVRYAFTNQSDNSLIPESDLDNPLTSAGVNANINTSNNSLLFDFLDNEIPNSTPAYLDLYFSITLNDEPFADGLPLTNQATLSQNSTNAGNETSNELVQIQIREPDLNVKKGIVATDNTNGVFSDPVDGPISFNAPGSAGVRFSGGNISSNYLSGDHLDSDLSRVDAGDLVTFVIVVENTGQSDNGAFDVMIKDSLPSGFAVPASGLNMNVSRGDGTAIAYTNVGGGSGLFDQGIELTDPGAQQGAIEVTDPDNGRNVIVITYDLVIDSTAVISSKITNTATLFNYASMEGGTDFSITDLKDDAVVTIDDISASKIITATNQAFTGSSQRDPALIDVAVGEIVTYQVTIDLAEGITNGVTLRDQLNEGLAYVDILSVVASSLDVTSSNSALSATQTDWTDIVTAATNTITNVDSGPENLGRRATFDFGDIVNANRDNSTAENITITYRAILLNSTIGRTERNDADLEWTGGKDRDNRVEFDTVEPHLKVTKKIDISRGDAGDTALVTLTVQHLSDTNSMADAFDLVLTDVIPDGMTYVAASIANPDGKATSFSESGGTITATWGSLEESTDETSTITFSVTLDSDVNPGDIITNTANLTWTSLPGVVDTSQTTHNTLGVERTGDTSDIGGDQNDYTHDDSDSVTITNISVNSKELVSTSIVSANNNTQQAVIGETAQYRVTLKIPEGVSNTVELWDTLDTGLEFVSLDSITRSSTDLTTTIGATDFSDPSSFSVDSSTQTLKIDLGNITNTNRDNSVAETLQILYTVRVQNIIDNQATDALDNSASVYWDGDDDLSNTPERQSNIVTADNDILVIEPELVVNKSVVGGAANPDAGDTFQYAVAIDHSGTSSADAFDLLFTDTIPTGLLITSIDSVTGTNSAGLTIADFAITGGGSGIQLASGKDLALADDFTVTYTVTVQESVTPGEILTNNVNLKWTSLDGTVVGERDGSGGVNDYESTDNTSVTVPSNFNVTKTVSSSTATIGDILTYTLEVNVIEGTTKTLNIIDTLPSGFAYVASSAKISNANGMTITGFNASETGGVLTLTATKVENPGNTDDKTTANSDSFYITYNVLVANVIENQNTNIKTNDADATAAGGLSDLNNQVNVTIQEPELNITKTASDTTPHLGDTITYTITVTHKSTSTANAYDLVLTDNLNSDLTLVAGSVTSTNGTVTTGNTAGDTSIEVDISTLSLGQTATITYQAVVTNDIADYGSVIQNTANLTWDTQSGANSNQRDGSGGINDLKNTVDENVTVVGHDLKITKTDGITIVHAGDILTYTLTIENIGTQNATGVLVTDTLDAKTEFVSASGNGVEAGGVITWGTFNLDAGDVTTRTVTVKVLSGSGSITNTANVTDDGSNGPDSNSANNQDTDKDTYGISPAPSSPSKKNEIFPEPNSSILYSLNTNRAFNAYSNQHADHFWTPRQPLLPFMTQTFSGHAAPNSYMEMIIIDSMGNEISRQSTLVGAGGHWLINVPVTTAVEYHISNIDNLAGTPILFGANSLFRNNGINLMSWSDIHFYDPALGSGPSSIQITPTFNSSSNYQTNLRMYFAPLFISGIFTDSSIKSENTGYFTDIQTMYQTNLEPLSLFNENYESFSAGIIAGY